LDCAVVVDEAPREPAAVEPRRPGLPEEERGLRGDVRRDAVLCSHRDVAPGGARRPAGGRIDQMVLRLAAATPAAPRDAARREAAAVEANRVAAGQADVDRPGRRDVATCADPAVADEREGVVDRLALDDAVQVEHHRLGAQEHPSAQPQREQGRDRHRLDRLAVEGKRREVAVVAGAYQCATGGRGDQAAGGVSCVERQ
jgi:hypothetical protein